MNEIIIDEEFSSIIPPLTDDEYRQLEENIIADGCREPLVVWRGIMMDGHNRYKICNEHGIKFNIVEYNFDDRHKAIEWIVINQLGRRNLAAYTRWELVKKLKPIIKAKADENLETPTGSYKKLTLLNSTKSIDTRKELAKLAGFSTDTVYKCEIIDEEITEETKGELRKAEKSINEIYQNIKRRERLIIQKQDYLDSNIPEIPPTIYQLSYSDFFEYHNECDLLITDPPYMTDVDDIETFAAEWLPVALDAVKDTGRAYIAIGAYPEELKTYLNIEPPRHLILENVLVWTYRNTMGPQPQCAYKLNWQAVLYYRGVESPPLNCDSLIELFTVQDINAPDGRLGDRFHTWQKPDELARRFIEHSTNPEAVVYDCFAGTGTFLIKASQLGRCAYGCDNNEGMIAIAVERGCNLESGCKT